MSKTATKPDVQAVPDRRGDLIDDDVKDNYRQLREQRDQSWAELEEQFRKDAAAAGAARGRGYALLADWAAREGEDDKPAKRRGRSRSTGTPSRPDETTAAPGPAETATPTGPQQQTA
ncbi:hypothetical protein [Angustibacter luteus]|uniref:Uncharacterized protein n=1 Tax=Angustibacter luteus TaxID=658456 RepID=A0ABW1JK35_9ACTN